MALRASCSAFSYDLPELEHHQACVSLLLTSAYSQPPLQPEIPSAPLALDLRVFWGVCGEEFVFESMSKRPPAPPDPFEGSVLICNQASSPPHRAAQGLRACEASHPESRQGGPVNKGALLCELTGLRPELCGANIRSCKPPSPQENGPFFTYSSGPQTLGTPWTRTM